MVKFANLFDISVLQSNYEQFLMMLKYVKIKKTTPNPGHQILWLLQRFSAGPMRHK